ncbi:MAG: hypothetical protein RLZZ200_2927 [Pseudomonadota bacterium]|jgi:hypothetical protein
MSSPAELLSLLRQRGRLTAAELRTALGISAPTLMRALRAAGTDVLPIGRGPRRSYAARRRLRGNAEPLPVYRIDAEGRLSEAGRLDLATPQGSALSWQGDMPWPRDALMRDGWFRGIPYLLRDLRPEGFLGRQFARRHATLLQVPEDPRLWSDDDVLHAMSLVGADVGGDLLIGETACRLWLEARQADATPLGEAPWSDYERLAQEAMTNGRAGSSAGGEFPKFTALRLIEGQPAHVLVKFSGNDDSPGTRRWSDLLVCESLAVTLSGELHDITGTTTHCVQHAGRNFLESVRFDRVGAHGRLPLCSWLAINEDWFGLPGRPWTEGAAQLHARRLIDADTRDAIERLWHFGRLIGNTDMHDGNLSFRPVSGTRFELAPVYDMLPMAWAPQRGVELPLVRYEPPLPMPAQRDAWQAAASVALRFWDLAAEDRRITPEFRAICSANAVHLRTLRTAA